ncbi:MAG: LysR family transcriptional regulator [Burkholderiales bacterium GWA2_64_37]|nr:MAG: LysR family transcriptional regulator [Burkholderiales bacterium GWA2_64_37]
MDLRYLQSLVAIIDYGSIAEAARRLDLTGPAVAARVSALEEELGAKLLERAGRSVKATELGARVAEQSRGILRDAAELKSFVDEVSRPPELRLGCFISATTSFLPKIMAEFYRPQRNMTVFVEPGYSPELSKRVIAGQLDAAIVVEHQFAHPKACEWRTLAVEPLAVVAPAIMAKRDAHDILRSEPFIRYDRRVWGGRLADRYLREQSIEPKQRMEIDGLMAIAALVAQGLGVSLLPNWAPMLEREPSLVRIPLPGTPPVRRIGMIWTTHGPRAHLADELLKAAVRAVGQSEQAACATPPQ